MGRRPTHDPRGYYRVLGLSADASEAEIKAAYRRKALELHPDRNSSPNAAAEFHFLSTAYRVLSDSRLRVAYHNDELDARGDHRTRRNPSRSSATGAAARASRAYARASGAGSRAGAGSSGAGTGTGGNGWQGSAPGGNGAQGTGADPGDDSDSATGRGSGSRTGPFSTLPPLRVCSSCRNVTAQPRYVIFPRVTGRKNRVVRDTVSGVFCSRCADRTALATALHNWVRGWWALPSGPPQTALALWTCLRGGIRPGRENHALLMEQARAFEARDQREIAWSLASDAARYAPGKTERQSAERLMDTLAARGEVRRLRNAWRRRGPGFWLQILFPMVLVLFTLMVAWPWLREDLPFSRTWDPKAAHTAVAPDPSQLYVDALLQSSPREAGPNGRLHAILSPFVIVRLGPGRGYGEIARLRQNTFVILVDQADDDWARIVTRDGIMGWVPRNALLSVDTRDNDAPAPAREPLPPQPPPPSPTQSRSPSPPLPPGSGPVSPLRHGSEFPRP
ncbi:DnaJ domain-containing protein [Phaeovibrio sulfidiphilus]|uniref:DnaJ domain-containing protein n=1 Tax=Phaeovibrio sulfidiphilus TaxID=1220600 RepID=UPI001F54B6CD|nr:DnaJ domain-containing protein [Phaeovibrio sulfidiphilus]